MSKKDNKSKKPQNKVANRRNFIKKLHLKNFKSFFGPIGSEIIDIKFAPKITLLFGRNSAGKSSLLQAIKLIQQSFDNDGDLVLNPSKSYSGGLYFPSYKDLVSKKETSRPIILGITAGENVGKIEDSKSIIKKFNLNKNSIDCAEVDFYSFTDDEKKFLTIKNQPFENTNLLPNSAKSTISFIENEYSWRELFKYTYINRKKVLTYLDRCIEFEKKFEDLLKQKNKKNSDKAESDIDKFVQSSVRVGEFSPFFFRFSENSLKKYKKFISNLKNNFKLFIKFISDDIKKNKKFIFKNNSTFNYGDLLEIKSSKDNKPLEDNEIKKIVEATFNRNSLADFLCDTVSRIRNAERPSQSAFDPNNPNDKTERVKTLDPERMISFCREKVSYTLNAIRIFQGQKALPSEYDNLSAYEENFVGYNYEFLHKVINNNKKEINKWLKNFNYDFKIETESGGPTSVTLIQHRKENFKINYKYGGLGAENVLPVIAQSVAADNKVLIFEEPERRAHPSLQVRLADLFVECSKKNQFIIETHSENLLLGILKNIRDGKISHKDVQVSYVHIEKGESKVDEMEINEKGNFENSWRHGFFTERLDLI